MKAVCTIDGCGKPHKSHGYCKNHLYSYKKYGDPLVKKQIQFHGLTLKERLEIRSTVRESGCIEWTGAKDLNGYGRINVDGYPMLVTRASWEVHNGKIPEGLNILHKCDNPNCLNPDHLFLGTQADNVADMEAKGRAHKARGIKAPTAKLTDHAVMQIRASTLSAKELSALWGVHTDTIRSILKRKTWTHI